jgi:hypothetical protein
MYDNWLKLRILGRENWVLAAVDPAWAVKVREFANNSDKMIPVSQRFEASGRSIEANLV